MIIDHHQHGVKTKQLSINSLEAMHEVQTYYIPSKCVVRNCKENYSSTQHLQLNSNELLYQNNEESISPDLSLKSSDTSHFRTTNELDTDMKTPTENRLITKDNYLNNLINPSQVIEEEYSRVYSPNEIYKEITSYNCTVVKDKIVLKEFLLTPLPQSKTLFCNIKTISNTHSDYCLLVQGNEFPLLRVKKQVDNNIKSAKYYIFMNKSHIVGRIKSNFLSSSFALDRIMKVDKIPQGQVTYKINPFGLFGARKMFIDLVTPEGTIAKYINKKAVWYPHIKEYRLKFNDRVKMASSKNFLIENDKQQTLLQFGKIDDETYAMDFQAPFSPLQAFSICITSILSKMMCE